MFGALWSVISEVTTIIFWSFRWWLECFNKKFFFSFLAVPHGMWDLRFPNQGLNLCPLKWMCRVSTTGLPGTYFLIKVCTYFRQKCYCTPNRLHYIVNKTFTWMRKPKNSCDSLYYNTCFMAQVWNQIQNISKECLNTFVWLPG